jgi:hypothetical protein
MGIIGLKAFAARTYRVSYCIQHRICSRQAIQTIDSAKLQEDE